MTYLIIKKTSYVHGAVFSVAKTADTFQKASEFFDALNKLKEKNEEYQIQQWDKPLVLTERMIVKKDKHFNYEQLELPLEVSNG